MTFKLAFIDEALEEWHNLDNSIRTQFKKKLGERLENPHIIASRLSGQKNRYKIKLRTAGYRLVYEVKDNELLVVVIAVGKRDKNAVYNLLTKRQYINENIQDSEK